MNEIYFTPKHVIDLIESTMPDFASGSSGFLLQFAISLNVVISNPPYDTKAIASNAEISEVDANL